MTINDNYGSLDAEIVSWYRGDNEADVLSSNDIFKGGEKYTVKIKLNATKYTFFDETYMVYVYTFPTPATVVSITPDEAYFTQSFTAASILNTISLTITEPKVGENPDYIITCGEPGYIPNNLEWYCEDDGNPVYPEDKFEKGKFYGAGVGLYVDSGYVLDKNNLKITVNGNDITYYEILDNGPRYIRFGLDYYLVAFSEILDDVSVTFVEPIVGSKPDYTVTTGDTKYTAKISNWVELFDGMGRALDPSQKFEEGKEYSADIVITAGEDCGFD